MPIAKCRIGEAHSAISSSSHSAFKLRHSAFSSRPALSRSKGFTFIEVLFAVILLGIGFIMIAAVFPVAIQQTSVVSDETQGTAIARDAIKKIQAVADTQIVGYPPPTAANPTYSLFQPTMAADGNPTVEAFSPNIMQALGSDSLFSADRRFGWVGFYRRDAIPGTKPPVPVGPFAQIYVIALENPNFSNYVTKFAPGEVNPISTPPPPILPTVAPPIPPYLYNYKTPGPAYVAPSVAPNPPTAGIAATITAQFYYNSDGSTSVVIAYPSTQASTNGITGAFLLVAGGVAPANITQNMVGRFFRLGVASNGSNLPSSFTPPSSGTYQIFQIQPGSDLTPADAQVNTFTAGALAFSANVWMIGAAPLPDANGEYTGPFSGPNQDIGVATGFIRVNTANN